MNLNVLFLNCCRQARRPAVLGVRGPGAAREAAERDPAVPHAHAAARRHVHPGDGQPVDRGAGPPDHAARLLRADVRFAARAD